MQSPLRGRIGMLAAGSIILAGLGASAATAAPAPAPDSVVTGSGAWYEQAYDNFPTGGYLTPQQDDVAGPQRAPFGTSSHVLNIGESSAQTELYRTDAYDDVPVSELTRLEYSTLARPTAGNGDRQAAYLRLSVDTDHDGNTDDSLYFFPANNGPVVNNRWHNWDVAHGAINVNGDGETTTTLTAYATAHPGATLVNDRFDQAHDAGSIALIAGGALGGDSDPQTRGQYFVDRVIVGENDQDTLFDFGGGDETDGANTPSTVDPTHDQGWQHQAYDNTDYFDSNQELVDGPATPPAGGGSLKFSLTGAGDADRVELFRTTQYDDTLLRDLRTIDYSTFQQANDGNVTPQQPVYVRLSVDTDGDGATDDSLFYYPGNNGTVQQGAWQTWNASEGDWGVNGDSGLAGGVSLEDYVVAHPDATIVENGDSSAPDEPRGGVAFMVGAAGANQMDGEYFLDDIKIGKVDAASGHTNSSKQFDLETTDPTLTIGNDDVSEGNGGATLRFPVTLSRPVARAVTVDYATSDGTAVAGSDYRAKSGTVTIPAGETTGAVTVTVVSNKVREANEKLTVGLTSPHNATIADGNAAGTIVNDDTRVGLVLTQVSEHRVRTRVSTVLAAAGARVQVYRVDASGPVRVLNTTLNSDGVVSVVLGRHYSAGRRVTMYSTVITDNGTYTSPRKTVVVRR